MENTIEAALLGMAIGSAAGIGSLNYSKKDLDQRLVADFLSDTEQENIFWSDDISLAFCMVEVLEKGYDLEQIIQSFIKWLKQGLWRTSKEIFIDKTTFDAINYYSKQYTPYSSLASFSSDSNGSLKRIIPLAFYLFDKPINIRLLITKEVTFLTHYSTKALLANFYILELVRNIITGQDPFTAYYTLQELLPVYLRNNGFENEEIEQLWRLIYRDIWHYQDYEINPTDDAIETLEAALWALYKSNSFVEALLNAIKLNGDRESISAITGALAGLIYGKENIPRNWIEILPMNERISLLAQKLYNFYGSKTQTV